MTQEELDILCVMAQNAITELVDDFITMYRRGEIDIRKRFAQILGLNALMHSIQNYDMTNWSDLSEDDLLTIKQKIIILADWR